MKTFRTGPWKEGHCHQPARPPAGDLCQVRAGSGGVLLWVDTERSPETQRSQSRRQKASLEAWKGRACPMACRLTFCVGTGAGYEL